MCQVFRSLEASNKPRSRRRRQDRPVPIARLVVDDLEAALLVPAGSEARGGQRRERRADEGSFPYWVALIEEKCIGANFYVQQEFCRSCRSCRGKILRGWPPQRLAHSTRSSGAEVAVAESGYAAHHDLG